MHSSSHRVGFADAYVRIGARVASKYSPTIWPALKDMLAAYDAAKNKAEQITP